MAGIAFTYDLGTAVGQARFYAGDTDGTGLNRAGGDRTRTDAEVGFLLERHGNEPKAAAAALLRGRAAEYAQQATETAQGELRLDYRARSRMCLEAAEALLDGGGRPVLQAAPEGGKPFTSGAPGGQAGTMDRW